MSNPRSEKNWPRSGTTRIGSSWTPPNAFPNSFQLFTSQTWRATGWKMHLFFYWSPQTRVLISTAWFSKNLSRSANLPRCSSTNWTSTTESIGPSPWHPCSAKFLRLFRVSRCLKNKATLKKDPPLKSRSIRQAQDPSSKMSTWLRISKSREASSGQLNCLSSLKLKLSSRLLWLGCSLNPIHWQTASTVLTKINRIAKGTIKLPKREPNFLQSTRKMKETIKKMRAMEFLKEVTDSLLLRPWGET